MALKRLEKIAETKTATSKDVRPVHKLVGNTVAAFNKAVEDQKDAEARVAQIRVTILGPSVAALYDYNINHPTAPVKTIDVIDASGAALRLTSQAKYSAANPEAAEQLFENLGRKHPDLDVDINDYVEEICTASFDQAIFNQESKDGEKRFSEKVYAIYAAAIEKVTRDLVTKGSLPVGTVSPLKTTKKVLPLGSFDEKRYVNFPLVEDQESIRQVLSNTITLTPSA